MASFRIFGALALPLLAVASELQSMPIGILAADDECGAEAAGACALHALQLKGAAIADLADQAEGADANGKDDEDAKMELATDVFPDESTGFDDPGPYLEEPTDAEAENPRPAKKDWENETSLLQATRNTWGTSFCESHHNGHFRLL